MGLTGSGVAHAADAVRGKALFFNTNGSPQSCGTTNCHAGFPSVLVKGIAKGADPAATLDAIAKDKGGMKILAPYVNSVDAADIAAYIANPAAANGTPAISLSTSSVRSPRRHNDQPCADRDRVQHRHGCTEPFRDHSPARRVPISREVARA
jgi:hypothetical protein